MQTLLTAGKVSFHKRSRLPLIKEYSHCKQLLLSGDDVRESGRGNCCEQGEQEDYKGRNNRDINTFQLFGWSKRDIYGLFRCIAIEGAVVEAATGL